MLTNHKILRVVTAAGIAASLGLASAALSQSAQPVKEAAPAKEAAPTPDVKSATPPGQPVKGFNPSAVTLPEALKLDTAQHDWGEISDQSTVEYEFGFTNVSDETVKVAVHASCGCTVAQLEKNTLAPGESTKAKARFDPKGRAGHQTKTVTISVTDPVQKYMNQSVVLSATVKALVVMEPPKVYLHEVDHRNGAAARVTVTGRKEGFQVTSVESNSSFVVARIGEPQVSETNGETLTKIEIDLDVGKGADIGQLASQLTIKTNDDRVQPVPLLVNADVVGTVRANPANAMVRAYSPSTAFSTPVRLDSRNGTPFRIRAIAIDGRDDMSLAADVVPGEGGRYYMLTLAGVTPATPGFIQGNIIVETDADGGETVRIPFTASVRATQPTQPVGVGKTPPPTPARVATPSLSPTAPTATSATTPKP